MSAIPRKLLSREEVEELLRRASLRDITVLNADANELIVCLAHTLLKTMDEQASKSGNITE